MRIRIRIRIRNPGSCRIPNLGDFSILDPEVKKEPDPGSGSATLVITNYGAYRNIPYLDAYTLHIECMRYQPHKLSLPVVSDTGLKNYGINVCLGNTLS
jgi:hypothetical protein